MDDESLTEPAKRTCSIDTWFVRFLIVACVLLFIEAILMLICKSLLMYFFYWALAIVAGELAIHYSKEQHDKIN